MGLYPHKGVRLGVPVDPSARTVEVFRPDQEPIRLQDPEAVPLDPGLPGVRPAPLVGLKPKTSVDGVHVAEVVAGVKEGGQGLPL